MPIQPRYGHFKLTCTNPGCTWGNRQVVSNPNVTTASARWSNLLRTHALEKHEGADVVTGLITDTDNPSDTEPLVVPLAT